MRTTMPDPFEPSDTPRLLTAVELALVVKMSRVARNWSQEALAAAAGLPTRTVQRVEAGRPSSVQTRRSLAHALGSEDIDAFSRPTKFLSLEQHAEKQRQEEEERKRNFLELPVRAAEAGEVVDLLARAGCFSFGTASGFEPSKDARRKLAEVQDFMTDGIDIAAEIGATGRLDLAESLDELVKELGVLGVALRLAERNTVLRAAPGGTPLRLTVCHIVACEKGREPESVWIPRKASLAS